MFRCVEHTSGVAGSGAQRMAPEMLLVFAKTGRSVGQTPPTSRQRNVRLQFLYHTVSSEVVNVLVLDAPNPTDHPDVRLEGE